MLPSQISEVRWQWRQLVRRPQRPVNLILTQMSAVAVRQMPDVQLTGVTFNLYKLKVSMTGGVLANPQTQPPTQTAVVIQ